MTVGVAAIGTYQPPVASGETAVPARQPVVILSTDRMITVALKREYEQVEQTKCFAISDYVNVLVAGSSESLLEICATVKQTADERQLTLVRDIARLFAEEFARVRAADSEQRVLAKWRLDWERFHSQQMSFAPEFRARLIADLDSLDCDLGEALIAGVDELGGHVYRVSDPGVAESCGQLGYGTIGIGAEFAAYEFMVAGYAPTFTWQDTLLLAYFAKKRAEVAPGVGTVTDLWWITRSGTMQIGPQTPIAEGLQSIYGERAEQERRALTVDRRRLARLWGPAVGAAPFAREGDEMERDPVCGMSIDPATVTSSLEWEGNRYYFCGPNCLIQFQQRPERYVSEFSPESGSAGRNQIAAT